MLGNADNIRFYLFSNELGREEIPPYKDYNVGNRDLFERDKKGKYFKVDKAAKVELFREGYTYLRKVHVLYGVKPDVRLITQVKDDLNQKEDWKEVGNIGLDLASADFNDTERTVQIGAKQGGLIEIIEKRWSDEYDILPNEAIDTTPLSALKTVNVNLSPRQILKRSRLFVEDGFEISAVVTGGDRLNAKAIPFQVDYNSDRANIQYVQGVNLNAFNDNYAKIQGANVYNLFYLNAERDHVLTFNGKVKTTQSGSPRTGTFSLDLVKYNNGDALDFKEVVQRLDTANPLVTGDVAEFTFVDYQVTVLKGESLAIACLSDTSDGIRYTITETELLIAEEDLYPLTVTKAIKPFDLFERLVAKITGKEGQFESSIFGPGGKYENMLIAHGSWLRNMPEIINEGEDDERRLQASVSLQKLYEAFGILEPLRYGTKKYGTKEKFEVGTEKETQANFIGIRIGETRGSFGLTQVQGIIRKVAGDNYYGTINIGSEKSGSNYGEVNNLYSICGNASWNTINDRMDSEYKALTEFRTGAEDIELQRQKQYADMPDMDGEYDNDWFLIDCKKVGTVYEPKKWQDYYSVKPTGVYSADTNYNWPLTPARLLLGHAWYLKAGFSQVAYAKDSIRFISSNCSSSLISEVSGKGALAEGKNIPHAILDKPTFDPMVIEFSHPVNQEIIDQLLVPENRNGLVEFLSEDGVEYGRLVKVDTNNEGKWTLIEAKIT